MERNGNKLRAEGQEKERAPQADHDFGGADSIPKTSQAARSAPADRPPVRVTWIARFDVTEPGTTRPRGCDGRPQGPRLGPRQSRSEASPSVVSWRACCAVTGRNQAQKKCAKTAKTMRQTTCEKASRDQPQEASGVQSREGEGSDPSPGVGRSSRPLAKP